MCAGRTNRIIAIICCLGWIASKPAPGVSAGACEPARFPVAIDIGHDRARPGALSARGVPEFEFNLALAREVMAVLRATGFARSFLIGESGTPLELRERTRMAMHGGARVLVSIHHDSVQPRYLRTWTHRGRVREYTTHARGFSLFVSATNSFFPDSKDLAVRIGSELRATGKRPSAHHAEPIEGEGRQIIDAVNGVYRFDDLVVLRTGGMPAVLLEAGVIKHPDDELVAASAAFQADVAGAMGRALQQVCFKGLYSRLALRDQRGLALSVRRPPRTRNWWVAVWSALNHPNRVGGPRPARLFTRQLAGPTGHPVLTTPVRSKGALRVARYL